MPDIKLLYNRYRKYIFFILALFVLGWGFSTYKTVFAGLIFGTTISFINLWLIYKKTIRLSEAVANGKSIYSMGSLSRFAYAALAVLIAIRFPNYIDIFATVIGLLTAHVVIFLDSIILFKNKHKKEER